MLKSVAGVMWRTAQPLGVNALFWAVGQPRLVVLNYHGVASDEQCRDPRLYGNVMGISEFSRQMEELARRFHPIGFSELQRWRAGAYSLPPRAVLVTFDDGYRNNLSYAMPVLERYGIPAIIHVSTGYIGQRRLLWPDEVYLRVLSWPERAIPMPTPCKDLPYPGEAAARANLANHIRESCKRLSVARLTEYLDALRKHELPDGSDELYGFLSWDDVRTLKERGFTIGGHTVEHFVLTQLTSTQLRREVVDCKQAIEQQLSGNCACFAYPNGGAADISRQVVQEVRQAGYEIAFTVTGRPSAIDADSLLIDRVYVPAGISMAEFRSRMSGLYSLLRGCLPGRGKATAYAHA
jgi:peptidoglycan/xylan/chitin deacetylase (PgdA/CDA1 family)